MNKEKAEGTIDKAKGKGRKAWGDASGDEQSQAEGQRDEAKGKGKDAWGDAKDKAGDLKDKVDK